MLMNAFDKPVQSNTEQAGRGHGFARMFDRVCAFLDERVGGASALIAACQSVADRFWHSKLYFPVCFLMLAVFMAAGLPVVGGVLLGMERAGLDTAVRRDLLLSSAADLLASQPATGVLKESS